MRRCRRSNYSVCFSGQVVYMNNIIICPRYFTNIDSRLRATAIFVYCAAEATVDTKIKIIKTDNIESNLPFIFFRTICRYKGFLILYTDINSCNFNLFIIISSTCWIILLIIILIELVINIFIKVKYLWSQISVVYWYLFWNLEEFAITRYMSATWFPGQFNSLCLPGWKVVKTTCRVKIRLQV